MEEMFKFFVKIILSPVSTYENYTTERLKKFFFFKNFKKLRFITEPSNFIENNLLWDNVIENNFVKKNNIKGNIFLRNKYKKPFFLEKNIYSNFKNNISIKIDFSVYQAFSLVKSFNVEYIVFSVFLNPKPFLSLEKNLFFTPYSFTAFKSGKKIKVESLTVFYTSENSIKNFLVKYYFNRKCYTKHFINKFFKNKINTIDVSDYIYLWKVTVLVKKIKSPLLLNITKTEQHYKKMLSQEKKKFFFIGIKC